MVAKDNHKTKGPNKAEMGDIDTSSPFHSVKDAVSLFGEDSFSGEIPAIKMPNPQSAERVLGKVTQLHLAQKELNKLKEQFGHSENTKAQALLELEKAKRTVKDLTEKLKIVDESKELAVRATEAAQSRAKQFSEGSICNYGGANGSRNLDLKTVKVRHAAVVTKLVAAKQELRKICQEYDASMEAKEIAAKQSAQADSVVKTNLGRASDLSKELVSILDSAQQVNLASTRANEERIKICAAKDKQKQLHKTRLEESAKKLDLLRKQIDPELTNNLEAQLGGTLSGIEVLQNELENTIIADLDSVKIVTMELCDAKKSLNKIAEEDSSLRNLLEALKLELENIKKEHSVVKEKEAKTEVLAVNLELELKMAKSELEEALAQEAKIGCISNGMIASIHQLGSESENAMHKAQDTKKKAEELKREADSTRLQLEEAEKRLRVAMDEAEKAKASEGQALDQIKKLSEKTDAARSSASEPGARITISRDEFESLSRKVKDSEHLADMKFTAAMAQVEAAKAGENEALKRLEAVEKEMEDVKTATEDALKKAEMSEGAKKAVEGELRRWRELERKKATETVSRILAETEKPFESSSGTYQINKHRSQEKTIETRKLERSKTSVAKKVLMPSLSSVFRKKRNKVNGRCPSYLPGEKPVW